ncbi:hypothetical protein BDR26DRAFT_858839 [Obelidium mucronatum]|nr:hypothetical protein BDR26DRAFT_858839 [Obelidium mucronatum]
MLHYPPEPTMIMPRPTLSLPPILFNIDPATDNLQMYTTDPAYSRDSVVSQSISNTLKLFSKTSVHPNRLIYAVAGIIFVHSSPQPFGGTKANPGFCSFRGTDAHQLLHYIISSAFNQYWSYKGRDTLQFVLQSVNYVMSLQRQPGTQDQLDELMMKGRKKSGHIEWFGAAYIPPELRHVHETDEDKSLGVHFTPVRRRTNT